MIYLANFTAKEFNVFAIYFAVCWTETITFCRVLVLAIKVTEYECENTKYAVFAVVIRMFKCCFL